MVFVLVSRAQLSLFIYFMCGQGYLINITLPMQYFWTLKRPSILFHTTFFSQNKRALVSLVLCCTDWLSHFLSDRFQHVIIDGCQSGWAPVLSGVRQGSILGAHLFILFVNNIPDFLSCPTVMFGNYTLVHDSSLPTSTSNLVQESFVQVCEWCRLWRLRANAGQGILLHAWSYTLANKQLKRVQQLWRTKINASTRIRFIKLFLIKSGCYEANVNET